MGQSAATQEISRSVQQASSGAESVAESISTVSEAAKATGEAVSQFDTICTRLSGEPENPKPGATGFVNGTQTFQTALDTADAV